MDHLFAGNRMDEVIADGELVIDDGALEKLGIRDRLLRHRSARTENLAVLIRRAEA